MLCALCFSQLVCTLGGRAAALLAGQPGLKLVDMLIGSLKPQMQPPQLICLLLLSLQPKSAQVTKSVFKVWLQKQRQLLLSSWDLLECLFYVGTAQAKAAREVH